MSSRNFQILFPQQLSRMSFSKSRQMSESRIPVDVSRIFYSCRPSLKLNFQSSQRWNCAITGAGEPDEFKTVSQIVIFLESALEYSTETPGRFDETSNPFDVDFFLFSLLLGCKATRLQKTLQLTNFEKFRSRKIYPSKYDCVDKKQNKTEKQGR